MPTLMERLPTMLWNTRPRSRGTDAHDRWNAHAWGLYQSNFAAFFEAVDNWDDHQKLSFVIAVGECGYQFDPARDDPKRFDVDIYHVESLKELAEQFVDEGLFGEIPEHLRNYLDYDAIARDLACDYASTTIAGNRLAYRCA